MTDPAPPPRWIYRDDTGILTLDLGAARAARAKKRAENGWQPTVVTFGGETFTLPAELPMAFSDALTANDAAEAMRVLLAADYPRFVALGPSYADMYELAGLVAEAFTAPPDKFEQRTTKTAPRPRKPRSGRTATNGGEKV